MSTFLTAGVPQMPGQVNLKDLNIPARTQEQIRQNMQKSLTRSLSQRRSETEQLCSSTEASDEESDFSYDYEKNYTENGSPASVELEDMKASERLEAFINKMMKKAELLNTTREEQILKKQQILEELQKVERELQEKAQTQLFIKQRLEQQQQPPGHKPLPLHVALQQSQQQQQFLQQAQIPQAEQMLQVAFPQLALEQQQQIQQQQQQNQQHQPLPLHIALQTQLEARKEALLENSHSSHPAEVSTRWEKGIGSESEEQAAAAAQWQELNTEKGDRDVSQQAQPPGNDPESEFQRLTDQLFPELLPDADNTPNLGVEEAVARLEEQDDQGYREGEEDDDEDDEDEDEDDEEDYDEDDELSAKSFEGLDYQTMDITERLLAQVVSSTTSEGNNNTVKRHLNAPQASMEESDVEPAPQPPCDLSEGYQDSFEDCQQPMPNFEFPRIEDLNLTEAEAQEVADLGLTEALLLSQEQELLDSMGMKAAANASKHEKAVVNKFNQQKMDAASASPNVPLKQPAPGKELRKKALATKKNLQLTKTQMQQNQVVAQMQQLNAQQLLQVKQLQAVQQQLQHEKLQVGADFIILVSRVFLVRILTRPMLWQLLPNAQERQKFMKIN